MDSLSNGNGNGRVTYAEVRRMARWLSVFTAQELADALRVNRAVGEKFVEALAWHGLLLPTEGVVDGEPLYEMDPLPDTIYRRDRRTPPEVMAVMEMGGFLLYNRRGTPIRLVDSDRQRQQMSQPGIRHRVKMRELSYQRQQQARKQRAEKQRIKAQRNGG